MKPKHKIGGGPSGNRMHRRDFLKLCGVVAGALSLDMSAVPKIAQALTADDRPPVIWLHFAECTGCTESILRTSAPWMDELIFNTISLDYHETLMAAAGETVEQILTEAASTHQDEFFCVVEGAIPTADNGVYGTIGNRTMLEIAQDILPKAKAIISLGTCSAYGGIAAAAPNPTGAKGVTNALPNLAVPVVNLPGCPPNPINFVALLASYLLNNSLPALDAYGRPLFAFRRKIHASCPYKRNETRCLKHEGCKGQWTYNNCADIKSNDNTSFDMQVGHPCIGCSDPGFWDRMSPVYGSTAAKFTDDGYPSIPYRRIDK